MVVYSRTALTTASHRLTSFSSTRSAGRLTLAAPTPLGRLLTAAMSSDHYSRRGQGPHGYTLPGCQGLSAPPCDVRSEEMMAPFVDVARLTVSTSMSSNEAELRAQGRSWYRTWTWQAPGRAEAALVHTSMVSWVTPGTQVGGGVQESNFEPCRQLKFTATAPTTSTDHLRPRAVVPAI